jgi:type 1 fimbriae regulatory protein FimE
MALRKFREFIRDRQRPVSRRLELNVLEEETDDRDITDAATVIIGARMPFQVHAHMLRHGCGYALADARHDTRAIQDWLGHRSIQHTVRYTELAPTRFKDFWRD